MVPSPSQCWLLISSPIVSVRWRPDGSIWAPLFSFKESVGPRGDNKQASGGKEDHSKHRPNLLIAGETSPGSRPFSAEVFDARRLRQLSPTPIIEVNAAKNETPSNPRAWGCSVVASFRLLGGAAGVSGDGALPGRPNSLGVIMAPPEQEIDLDHRLIDCRGSYTHPSPRRTARARRADADAPRGPSRPKAGCNQAFVSSFRCRHERLGVWPLFLAQSIASRCVLKLARTWSASSSTSRSFYPAWRI
jgi:hypothetical protein